MTASDAAPWVVRQYVPEDEDCVVSTWLKGFARSRAIRSDDLAADEIRYWKVYQPIVVALLARSEVRVLCDPDRVEHKPDAPAVIWAWSATSADDVHWVMVKRSAGAAGLARDMVRDLLGDRLERHQRATFELVDLEKHKLAPACWTYDNQWLYDLQCVSTRLVDRDALFAVVASHIVDTRRIEWQPGQSGQSGQESAA